MMKRESSGYLNATVLHGLVLMTMALFLTIMSAGLSQAQIRPPGQIQPKTIPKVIVFSGKGPTPAPAPPARRGRRAGSSVMDLATARSAVKAATGKDVQSSNEYAILTPNQPVVANRAYLSAFGDVTYVTTGTPADAAVQSYIGFSGSNSKLVAPGKNNLSIFVKPASGQTYLVDLYVYFSEAGPVDVYGPGGEMKMTFPAGEQHILILLSPGDAEWKNIVATPGPNTSMTFMSCKVTILQ